MSDLYPELRGQVVDAEALMTYIFNHHEHHGAEGTPYVPSLPLDQWLRDQAHPAEPSDGFHTMAELYDQRMLYHALAVKMMSALVGILDQPAGMPPGVPMLSKSWRHHDGEPCFGKTEPGERWFIVTLYLPNGAQVTQHYPEADWDLFDAPALPTAPPWDGHTPEGGNARLRNYLERPR
jgi:hypothetical protein